MKRNIIYIFLAIVAVSIITVMILSNNDSEKVELERPQVLVGTDRQRPDSLIHSSFRPDPQRGPRGERDLPQPFLHRRRDLPEPRRITPIDDDACVGVRESLHHGESKAAGAARDQGDTTLQ